MSLFITHTNLDATIGFQLSVNSLGSPEMAAYLKHNLIFFFLRPLVDAGGDRKRRISNASFVLRL